MKLGGWQRLWVLIAGLWIPAFLWHFHSNLRREADVVTNTIDLMALTVLLAGGVVLFVVYPAMITIAWVRRGFAQPDSK